MVVYRLSSIWMGMSACVCMHACVCGCGLANLPTYIQKVNQGTVRRNRVGESCRSLKKDSEKKEGICHQKQWGDWHWGAGQSENRLNRIAVGKDPPVRRRKYLFSYKIERDVLRKIQKQKRWREVTRDRQICR